MSNDIPLTSFDYMVYHRMRAKISDFRATPIPKNTLANKFPLTLDGEYHPFVTSKPMVPCQLCMYNGIEMEIIMT